MEKEKKKQKKENIDNERQSANKFVLQLRRAEEIREEAEARARELEKQVRVTCFISSSKT